MQINPYIFRGYDIRGLVPQDLNGPKVEIIGKAYGTFLRRRKIRQAVVGHDCRLSGEQFSKAFIKGLTTTGVDVIDIGTVMTQMVYFAQYLFQANGGTMITASHNPANFNGFKLATGYSKSTEENDIREIKEHTIKEDFFVAKIAGKVIKKNINKNYYNDVLKRIALKKKFKVVIDSRHGTTGLFIPEILKRAGCKVIGRNLKVDGNFPAGTPDPTDEKYMKELGKFVLEQKADLGFCFDGDGDRMGLVDAKGRLLWNDVMVAIFAQEILERFPKSKIIYNTLCSQVVRETIKKNNGIPVIERTGHSFIKSRIASENAAFGGELSGHFFFADNAYGHDDGSYAALRILEYLSEKNMSLAALYENLPQYISSPEIKIGCPDNKKMAIIEDLSKKFKADFPNVKINDKNTLPGDDGVRADFNDGMMVFRYSQNGPYITIKFEAKDKKTYEQRRTYVKKMLQQYPEMIWQDQLCVNLDHLQ